MWHYKNKRVSKKKIKAALKFYAPLEKGAPAPSHECRGPGEKDKDRDDEPVDPLEEIDDDALDWKLPTLNEEVLVL